MQILCVLWFLVFVFYLLKTFPELWEDHPEPAAARTSVEVGAVTRRRMGLPKSRSQLVSFLRFLFAWGGGRRWAKFPLPGTPFPPFFTWRTPTRPSRPSSNGISSRKPSLISQLSIPFASVLPYILCLPLSVSATDMQSVVVTFESVTPRRL